MAQLGTQQPLRQTSATPSSDVPQGQPPPQAKVTVQKIADLLPTVLRMLNNPQGDPSPKPAKPAQRLTVQKSPVLPSPDARTGPAPSTVPTTKPVVTPTMATPRAPAKKPDILEPGTGEKLHEAVLMAASHPATTPRKIPPAKKPEILEPGTEEKLEGAVLTAALHPVTNPKRRPEPVSNVTLLEAREEAVQQAGATLAQHVAQQALPPVPPPLAIPHYSPMLATPFLRQRVAATQRWLERSNGQGYSIQLMVVRDPNNMRRLDNFFQRADVNLDLEKLYLVPLVNNGILIFFDEFSSYSTARKTARQLPRKLRRGSTPFPRPMHKVQREAERVGRWPTHLISKR